MRIVNRLKRYVLSRKYGVNLKKVDIQDGFIGYDKVDFYGYCYIGSNFQALGKGRVKIMDNVIIAHGFSALTTLHQVNDYDLLPYDGKNDLTKNIIIEENVWIGANVTVFGGVTIGEGAVIGANSLVTKDVPKCSYSVGVPAKTIKYRNIQQYKQTKEKESRYLFIKKNRKD